MKNNVSRKQLNKQNKHHLLCCSKLLSKREATRQMIFDMGILCYKLSNLINYRYRVCNFYDDM